MAIYQPKELLAYLERIGAKPSKRLSQNFLIDGNIIRKIAAAAEASPGDLVIEIGAGPGALTDALVETGADVIAVEKDRRLAEALRERIPRVIEADVMECRFADLLEDNWNREKKVKIAANLPYSLTTPIIEKILNEHELFSFVVLMVQEEVARRMTAKPGGKEYGSLTLFLSYKCEAKYAFKVSRHCFFPSPSVDSAVVILKMKQPPAVSCEVGLFKLIRNAFGQRRKMVRNTISSDNAIVLTALEEAGLNSQCRAEELSLENFISLYEALSKLEQELGI